MAADGLRFDDLNGRVLFLQPHADAHQRPGCAERRDEMRQRAVGLLPDLFRRRAVVRQLVVDIHELVRVEIFVRLFCNHRRSFADGAVGAFGGGRQHDFAAESLDHPAAFNRNGFAHHDDDVIAFDRSDHGQTDAGVAAGGFDDGFARRQAAVGLGLFDHGERNPVLDAAGRVEPFQLRPDFNGGVRGHMVDGNQRRVADGVQDVSIHGFLFPAGSLPTVSKKQGRKTVPALVS